MNRIRWYGPTLVLLATAIVIMLVGPRLTQQLAHSYKGAELQLVRDSLRSNGSLADMSNSFKQVAEVVGPSVVHIQTLSKRRAGNSGRQLPDELRRFRRFFPFEEDNRDDRQRDGANDEDNYEEYNEPRPVGSGSGWVYSKDGHIVTNNHVITTGRDQSTVADQILVRFDDGTEYEAEVVGRDEKTDIAVIKVSGGKFHPATLAADEVEQGGIVFAFGSPFGYQFSMSQGIVSATGREIGIIRDSRGIRHGYENFIQTDAAINRGNSGGPLTNIYGEVIGMNTVIASSTGQFSGLGFAIPADQIRNVVAQLIESGQVKRGYLGIMIRDLELKMARSFGFEGKGVLVSDPLEGEPAQAAGVRSGDIITKVDGRKVTTAHELRFLVADKGPGTAVELEIFRDGKTITKTVKLGRLPDTDKIASSRKSDDDMPGDNGDEGRELLRKLGLRSVSTYDEDTAKKLRLPFVEGVMVNRVRSGSIANAAGIGRGTIITHVMGDAVTSVDELVDALDEHDLSQGVRIQIEQPNPSDRGKLMTGYALLEMPKQ